MTRPKPRPGIGPLSSASAAPVPSTSSSSVAAAAAARRTSSSASFHAGAPIPTLTTFRRLSASSTVVSPPAHRYQTFAAPKLAVEATIPSSRASLAASHSSASSISSAASSSEDEGRGRAETPLPVRQLLLLAFLSLSEQTALNSISPYLPQMVVSMPGIPRDEVGLYVGILASAFALAQLSTNFLWGYASDLVGRKPVLLAGTAFLMICFCVFGFCQQYWQVVVVHVAMGLLNGNAACVPTVLGEVTDRSNQSKAFTYLPVIYSLGSITGPALGGILVGKIGGDTFPFLGPNVLGAAMLALSVVVVGIWFEETLDDSDVADGPWRPQWITSLTSWFRRPAKRPALNRNSWSSRWPTNSQQRQPLLHAASPSASDDDDQDEDETEVASGSSDSAAKLQSPPSPGTPPTNGNGNGQPWRDLLNRTTVTLLVTYLVFQLSNISYNSLYPIFAASPPPTGRGLSPDRIGLSLSLAGVATILFQAFLYQPLKAHIGSLGAYRLSLWGIAVSMVLMPWVGYTDDEPLFGVGSARAWLYAELGLVLILKNICAVGGLSSVMLLITNSAPSHASLGTLNGVAQTLSALGRSIGPFVSGGLFTLSTGVHPKGEALAWSLFGGLALVGAVGALFIRGDGLESEDWEDEDEDGGESGDEPRGRQNDDSV
ncbi:MFS transporter [Purpureocillium lavendulum]|uniref:MFS transporter n=1 Tax=Purpureocillium lavendulum TaxID=1247861 RepID=A0AB34FGT3_9HYPO|nr:MFS transporter [Purpureocillium lavendulum]